jgi:hypothetical protein
MIPLYKLIGVNDTEGFPKDRQVAHEYVLGIIQNDPEIFEVRAEISDVEAKIFNRTFICSMIMGEFSCLLVASSSTFLILMCCFVSLGLSLVPLSIDMGITNQTSANKSCISIPWLLATGFSMSPSQHCK